MLFPQFQDLLTNLCRTSLSTLKGPIPTRRVFWSSCRYSSNRSDTNCWDCEIPCSTLSYLISTILSTLGLRGWPAWIYFWFPFQKASYY
ncbi:hypothetical protein BRARA_A01494 [Brassica rapa]|uniref:Uncharacterized protein n=1 Tax=Brassica campestris TaxID=3711 RepID=A0A398AP60_BRACM|nr:hypothetical protein BRARA_A01494 [Brassica rapa]